MEPQTFDLSAFQQKNSFNLNQFDFNDFWQKKSNHNNEQSFYSIENKQKKSQEFSLGDFEDRVSQKNDGKPASGNNSQIFVIPSNIIEKSQNLSKNLDQISFERYQKQNKGVFKYEKQIPNTLVQHDPNYEKLKATLPEIKKYPYQNSQHSNRSDHQQMYRSKEFDEYIQSLKFEKKLREQKHQQQRQSSFKRNSQKNKLFGEIIVNNNKIVQKGNSFQSIEQKQSHQFSLGDFGEVDSKNMSIVSEKQRKLSNNSIKIQQNKQSSSKNQNLFDFNVQNKIDFKKPKQGQVNEKQNSQKSLSLSDFAAVEQMSRRSSIQSVKIKQSVPNEKEIKVQIKQKKQIQNKKNLNPIQFHENFFEFDNNFGGDLNFEAIQNKQLQKKKSSMIEPKNTVNFFDSQFKQSQPNNFEFNLSDFKDASQFSNRSSIISNKNQIKKQEIINNNNNIVDFNKPPSQKKIDHNMSKQQFSLNDFGDPQNLSKRSSIISQKNHQQNFDFFDNANNTKNMVMDKKMEQFSNVNNQIKKKSSFQDQIRKIQINQQQKSKQEFSLNDFADQFSSNPSAFSNNASMFSNIINNNLKKQQIKQEPIIQQKKNINQLITMKQTLPPQQSKQKNSQEFSLGDFGSVVENNSQIKSSIISKINSGVESKIIPMKIQNNVQLEYGFNENFSNIVKFESKSSIQKDLPQDFFFSSPIQQKKSIQSNKSINQFAFFPEMNKKISQSTNQIKLTQSKIFESQKPEQNFNFQKKVIAPEQKILNIQVQKINQIPRNQIQFPNNEFNQFSNFEKQYSSFSNKVINTENNKIVIQQNQKIDLKQSKINNQKQLSLGDFADPSSNSQFSKSSVINKLSQVFENKVNLVLQKNQKVLPISNIWALQIKKEQLQNSKQLSHVSSNKQIKKSSFSLNDFPDPDQFSEGKSSGISRKFNVEKESSGIFERSLNTSRSIGDISFQQFNIDNNNKYISNKINNDLQKHNAQYEKLKRHLSDKRNVNMNQFFKQLSEQNQRQKNQPNFITKYSSRQQFEQYIKKIKLEKKIIEQTHQKQRQNIKDSGKNLFKKKQENYIPQQPIKQFVSVKKVIQLQDLKKPIKQKQKLKYESILTLDMIDHDFKEPEREIEVFQIKKSEFESQDFFDEEERDQVIVPPQIKPIKQNKQIKKSKKDSKLTPIREQNSNIFQKTIEEQKISKLYKTYDKFRQDFDRLIGQMKSNRQGQQNLMKQIANLKNSYNETHQKQIQKLEQKLKIHSIQKIKQKEIQNEKYLQALKKKEIQQQQFHELKKQILQIKNIKKNQQNSQNQILQKITQLQQVVKKSFQQLTESRNKYLTGSPSKQKYPDLNQISIQQSKLIDESRNKITSPRTIIQQLYSPLQLNLNDAFQDVKTNRNNNTAFAGKIIKKEIPEFAEVYIPKRILSQFNFKSACIQQNCVIYQSFQFLINVKYSIVRADKKKNIKILISIKNKMIITLNDLIVIIYGSAGQVLSVSPPKIYCQKMQPQQIVNIEVYLNEVKLENQFLSVQLCYRGQKSSKKKISLKVPRPITKFFDIKFTHEAQFKQIYNEIRNQLFVESKLLNFKQIKTSEDIKIILPFIDLSQQDDQQFSYGLLFNIYNMEGLYLLKLMCTTDGKASLHIRYEYPKNKKFAETILDVLNSVLYA